MSDSISKDVNYQPSQELCDLVDKMIDDRLQAEERDRLELLMETDEAALDYCAQRMRFIAELEESMTPVRVELTQKRHLVLEKKGGLASVSRALTNVVKIENPKHGKAVEFPPNLTSSRKVISRLLAGLVVFLFAVVVIQFVRREEPLVAQPTMAQLEFRNASFDDLSISEKSPPYIMTTLEWQDYFQTSNVKVCDVERITEGAREAKDGDYAAYLKKGFLTQRLTHDDGSAFVAKKGLKLRVTGWAMLEKAGAPCPLSIATRVVTSPYPAMQQVEPSVETVLIEKDQWQKVSVILTLPDDSLVMKPTIERSTVEGEAVDVTDLNLAISIDNRSSIGIYLDAMSIEVVE